MTKDNKNNPLLETLKLNNPEVIEAESKYGAFAYIILDPERKGREISKLLSQSNLKSAILTPRFLA